MFPLREGSLEEEAFEDEEVCEGVLDSEDGEVSKVGAAVPHPESSEVARVVHNKIPVRFFFITYPPIK
jgi:hypothetical protein